MSEKRAVRQKLIFYGFDEGDKKMLCQSKSLHLLTKTLSATPDVLQCHNIQFTKRNVLSPDQINIIE